MLVYGVFALGAICMLLGFWTVIRGVGTSESETTVKMFGIEFKASKLGPGLVFSVLGLILVIVAANMEKGPLTPKPEVTPTPAPAPAPAPKSDAPPAPQPGGLQPAPGTAANPPADQKPQGMSHEEVAALIKDTLQKIALGYCPPENFEPLIYNQCQQGGALMRQNLLRAGPIQDVSYAGRVATVQGPSDQYRVIFQSGPMIWYATVTENRKFSALWYPQ